MEKILQIKNLSKSFGSRKILHDVTLDVHKGEIVGYLGPNGSGKTTTIKLILGLLKITQGSITICGKDVGADFEGAIANVGGIIENPEMYSYLSARENLKHYARMYHSDIDKKRMDEVLELVGLTSRADDKISKYSLGMRQRLGVAQAILHKPALLVLDEPTNGLDPAGIKDLRDLLKRLSHEQGLAVLVSSHLLSELELLCDSVAVLNHGRVVGSESLLALQSASENALSTVKITTPQSKEACELLCASDISASFEDGVLTANISHEDIPNIIRLLSSSGINIYAVEEQKRTLEAAFLEMTTDLRTDERMKKEVSKE